jgi:hypothetical protein
MSVEASSSITAHDTRSLNTSRAIVRNDCRWRNNSSYKSRDPSTQTAAGVPSSCCRCSIHLQSARRDKGSR